MGFTSGKREIGGLEVRFGQLEGCFTDTWMSTKYLNPHSGICVFWGIPFFVFVGRRGACWGTSEWNGCRQMPGRLVRRRVLFNAAGQRSQQARYTVSPHLGEVERLDSQLEYLKGHGEDPAVDSHPGFWWARRLLGSAQGTTCRCLCKQVTCFCPQAAKQRKTKFLLEPDGVAASTCDKKVPFPYMWGTGQPTKEGNLKLKARVRNHKTIKCKF